MFPHAFFPISYFANPYFGGSGAATWTIRDYLTALDTVNSNPFGVDPSAVTLATTVTDAFSIDPNMVAEAT